MKKFLTLIAVAAMAFAAQAAELTVFDGTATNDGAPIYGYNFDSEDYITQTILPEAELTALQGKSITEMKFYVANEGGSALSGGKLAVSIGTTALASYPSWSPSAIEGLTHVADITMTAGVTEIVVTFDAPFVYEGGNLVIETKVVEAGGWANQYFYGVESSVNNVLHQRYAASVDAFYPKTTFTYEGGEVPEPGIATLAEANALEDAAEFTFDGDAVVTVFKSGYLFLRDESGYGMIAGVTGEFANGQVLSEGWNATKTSDDGWVWYTGATDLSASGETNAELAAAQKLTEFPDESMLNAYVYVENVTISGGLMPGVPMRALPLPDGTSIGVTSTLWSMSWPAGGSKNIYGVICKDNGALKINVVDFQNYVEPEPEGLRGDVNNSNDVTIADVTALIDYLLSGDATNISLENSDCNLSGDVSIADVTALIDYLLSGAW